MKQYLDLLQNILDNGVEKESGRPNMPNTIGISNATITMNLSEGYPLLTTKKMFLKGIIHELLWMLRGETNIKYLVDNGVQIWSGDAYRWYLKYAEQVIELSHHGDILDNKIVFKNQDNSYRVYTQKEFIEQIKLGNKSTHTFDYRMGDLGKVYGYQWRNQNGVDQIRDVIEGLRDNPYSRYHIIDAWQKSDFKDMALPPCHLLYQFIVRPLSIKERRHLEDEKNGNKPRKLINYVPKFEHELLDKQAIPKFYLDLDMYQRSVDSACGLPFNLASMSLLLEIISKVSNMIPGVATWIGGDTHIYLPHIETVKKQIQREPYKLPTIKILKDIKTLEDIEKLTINDFKLIDYQSHEKLEYELFVGLKK